MEKNKAPTGCQVTKIGTHEGNMITAASDMLGHQVIYRGEKIHLLSKALASHKDAVTLGRDILKNGPDVYKEWNNLKNESIGTALVRIAEAQVFGTFVR